MSRTAAAALGLGFSTTPPWLRSARGELGPCAPFTNVRYSEQKLPLQQRDRIGLVLSPSDTGLVRAGACLYIKHCHYTGHTTRDRRPVSRGTTDVTNS